MNRWAGWIITLAGAGHTIGSLIETFPHHAGAWFNGSLWRERDFAQQSDAAAGFWYSVFSFGPPLILIGLIVLWLARHGLTPPAFVPWSVAAWVIITFATSGPSPLPVLLVAAAMLLIASRRPTGTERDAASVLRDS